MEPSLAAVNVAREIPAKKGIVHRLAPQSGILELVCNSGQSAQPPSCHNSESRSWLQTDEGEGYFCKHGGSFRPPALSNRTQNSC